MKLFLRPWFDVLEITVKISKIGPGLLEYKVFTSVRKLVLNLVIYHFE